MKDEEDVYEEYRNRLLVNNDILRLEIYETDFINGGNVLILKAYCVRKNGGIWSLNEPQIFNSTVYSNNKESYDQVIQQFRNDCQGTVDDTSLMQNEIDTLKEENQMIMLAIAELAESSDTVETV